MYSKPGAVVWCFQTTAPNSIELQQPRVWKYMPPEWRNARKGQVTNITYSVKGGFTEAKFVAPNQAVCIFRNYAQDPSTIEGGEIDACWCDELVRSRCLETLAIPTRRSQRQARLSPSPRSKAGHRPWPTT
jgi:hypothetical protein